MKVKVKKGQKGFIYGKFYNEGDEFELRDDKLFSNIWMEKVPAKKGPKPKKDVEAE